MWLRESGVLRALAPVGALGLLLGACSGESSAPIAVEEVPPEPTGSAPPDDSGNTTESGSEATAESSVQATDPPTPEPTRAVGLSSAERLNLAAEQTGAADALRWEMWLTMAMSIDGVTYEIGAQRPSGYGHNAASSVYSATDMGSIFEGVAGNQDLLSVQDRSDLDLLMARADELIMETVETEDYLFMRMPMMAVLDELFEDVESDPQAAPLLAIAQEWGVLDLEEFPEASTAGLAQAQGSQGVDPDAYVHLLDGAAEVREVGPVTIRGSDATLYFIRTTYEQALLLQGMDPAAFEQQLIGSGLSADEARAAAARIAAEDLEVDIIVDDEGFVRQVRYFNDFAQALGAVEGLLSMEVILDFFDHNSPDIGVEVPDPATAVDLADLLGLRFGGPASANPDTFAECASDPDANDVGDNAGCDALYRACADGDMGACDDLWWSTPIGSKLEAFAATCGGRLSADDPNAGGGDCLLLS